MQPRISKTARGYI